MFLRAGVAEDRKPEVYRVDLRAILFLDDPRTNIVVQPRDQVFVGERPLFSLERCIAPWLRPFYETVFNLPFQSFRDRGLDDLAKSSSPSR